MSATVIALISLALLGAVAACVVLVRRWRAEQAEVRRVRSTFSRYVPAQIVSELLGRKDERIFTGREMRATIMVARIWNFSQIIENLTPEQTLRYLNEFYAIAGASIERQHGVLHRFLEDGVVGIFGVPIEDGQQEDNALRAAINIIRLVSVMQEKWIQQNRKPLRVGIGINSGNVIAGDAGFAQRREYTVVGPDVTLAHRLAQITSDLNTFLVASRSTIDPVREMYHVIPVTGMPLAGVRALLDAVIVRGRKAGDPLTLPKAGTFATTILDEHIADLGEIHFDAIPDVPLDGIAETPPLIGEAVDESAAPEPTPAPDRSLPAPLRTRRRPRQAGEDPPPRGFDLPELRGLGSFGRDEEAIMPDPPHPPPPRATYEDNDGPPLQL